MTQDNSSALGGRARWTLAVIGLLSIIGLAYEVTLTRLFSLIFQYHYVFLIVSLAVVGLSLGAALASLLARRGDQFAWGDLVNAALLLAILLAGSILVISQLRSATLVGVALGAGVLPFVAIGLLNALIYRRFAAAGGTLYAADLLGGAVGLVLALLLVSVFGAYTGILALSVLAALAAALLAWLGEACGLQRRALALAVVLLIGTAANALLGAVDFFPAYLADAPPDKTLVHVLREDEQARLTETRWDPFARVDVVETADEAVRYVFTDAGAGSIMVGYDGDPGAVSWLRRDVPFLPFTVGQDLQDVLIIGAGAGQDVLMAHLAGAEAITAVEINPTLVNLTRDQAAYNGGVYDLPGVETVVMDGRNFIEHSTATYDLIYANVVYSQAAAPTHSALAESYIYTREALHAYWDHLSDDGRIGFVTHHGIEGLRLLVAALDMLQGEGYTLVQALDHVALASLRGGDAQTRTSVVMILRQPWTLEAAADFSNEAHARNAGLLYLPTYQELGLEMLTSGALSLEAYIAANSDYNYTPTTDDQPFFYQFTPGLPDGLSQLLALSLAATFVYGSWVVFFYVRRDYGQWKRASLTPYFGLLGAAFMLVEVPLIQQFSLLLGQPVLALVVVIGALLIGGGLGSLVSRRFSLRALPRLVMFAAVGVAVLVGLLRLAFPALFTALLPLSLGARVIMTLGILLLPAFLMGMCFPSGLRLASVADPDGVAALWGANAITSVLGSALAMSIAVAAGFAAALLAGALLYVGAAALAALTWPRLLAA